MRVPAVRRSIRIVLTVLCCLALTPMPALGLFGGSVPAPDARDREPLTSPGRGETLGAPVDSPEFVPGQLLVRFKPGTASVAKNLAHAAAGALDRTPVKALTGIELVEIPEGASVESAVRTYAADPSVLVAQPNYVYRISQVPDDPDMDLTWGLNYLGQYGPVDSDIDAPEAWDIETGNRSVVVAVVDTGVDYNHPDLHANIWTNPDEIPLNGKDDDGNGWFDDHYGIDSSASDPIGWDSDPFDDNAHGTHVAGTIGAVANNGIGVAGVNWDVSIMPLKCFDPAGTSTTMNEIVCIDYARAKHADVINASWGGGSYDPLLEATIANFPGLFVAAAGNDRVDMDATGEYHFPAAYELPNIVSVMATDYLNRVADFDDWGTNWGADSVDLGAPGVDTYSTVPTWLFRDIQGTPMATGFLIEGEFNAWSVNTSTSVIPGAQKPWEWYCEDYFSPFACAAHVGYQDGEEAWMWRYVDLTNKPGCVPPMLDFRTKYDLGPGDSLDVMVSRDGTDWWRAHSLTGSSGPVWGNVILEFEECAYDSGIYIAFVLKADDEIDSDAGYFGAMIDDVYVDYGEAEPWVLASGTSMAAPHVSGTAALMLARSPGLSPLEAGQIILDTVEPIDALEGKTVTGGRLNAADALAATASDATGAGPWTWDDAVDYTDSALIRVQAYDPSGVESVSWSVDGGPWTTTEGDLALAGCDVLGLHTLSYYATDLLGNVSEVASTPFKVRRGGVAEYVGVAGINRYETAVEASKRGFPEGAEAVVIATGSNWPDALGGAALAGVLDAPILLTEPNRLTPFTAQEVARLGALKAYVLGGTGAVSNTVYSALCDILGDANVKRVAGTDRYGTAAKIADEVIALQGDGFDGTAFMATGANYPDALGASAVAAGMQWPLVLVAPGEMPSLPAGVTDAVVLGGTAAVSPLVENELISQLGAEHVTRKAGADRYVTAAEVAAFGVQRGLHFDGVGVATGQQFPDALTGGAMLAQFDAVMLLTPSGSLASSAGWQLSVNKEWTDTVHFIGGSGALSDTVRTEVKRIVDE